MSHHVVAALVAVALAGAALPAQQHQESPAAARASAPPAVQLTRVRLATGVELEVALHGPTDGEPVLFLHGFPDSHFSFTPVLPHLPPNIRAILPSQRGFGDSERPTCCYGMGDFAADAAALLDALGIARATVVGHSMGSFIAQRTAIDYPERVSRLVLVGSGFSPRTKPVVEFGAFVKTLADPVPITLIRDFQQSAIGSPVPQSFFDRVVSESEKLPARIWRDAIAGLLTDSTVGNLQSIRARTLLVSGEKDAFWEAADREALRAAIPGARLLTYDGVGHSPNWEQPARFAADLLALIAEDSGARRMPEPTHGGAHGGAHAHGSEHGTGSSPSHGVMPLLSGLGEWHLRITTSSPDAQRYFDQGLRLMYAFNHDEALRSFARAVALDSTCALCHWGMAYALGPNINLPMDAAAEPRAVAAIGTALHLARRVSPRERDLVEAMVRRYGEPGGIARAARDSAYARAMRTVARRYPNDADIQVFFADAMLNLRPWNQWTRDGRPQPGTEELVAALERAIRIAPDHAGGCHFYIHAVEASETPERALPCAERLPRLMPGAGHVVHMPSHVYLRVGRYEDAARANIAAVETDGRYFAARTVPDGMYPMFYAPHNLHFLWATYLLSGQRHKALGAARALTQRVKPADARTVPSLEGFLVAEVLTHVRFGDWDAVLAMPAPPAELRFARGMWHYARGVASSARGDLTGARTALDSVRAIAGRLPADMIIILNPAPALLQLAAEVLDGRIAARQQRYDVAVARFRSAAALEDALTYDEPPAWYHSARHLLGEVLLDAGRPAEAEVAFREDLRYVRETGWSLSGLQRALQLQGRTADASAVASRLQQAWQYADGATSRGR